MRGSSAVGRGAAPASRLPAARPSPAWHRAGRRGAPGSSPRRRRPRPPTPAPAPRRWSATSTATATTTLPLPAGHGDRALKWRQGHRTFATATGLAQVKRHLQAARRRLRRQRRHRHLLVRPRHRRRLRSGCSPAAAATPPSPSRSTARTSRSSGDFVSTTAHGRDDIFWYAPGTAADSLWRGRGRRRLHRDRRSRQRHLHAARRLRSPRTRPPAAAPTSRLDIFWYARARRPTRCGRATATGALLAMAYNVERHVQPFVGLLRRLRRPGHLLVLAHRHRLGVAGRPRHRYPFTSHGHHRLGLQADRRWVPRPAGADLLVVAHRPRRLLAPRGRARPRGTTAPLRTTPTWGRATSPSTGDFDGDGANDISTGSGRLEALGPDRTASPDSERGPGRAGPGAGAGGYFLA